MPSSSNELYFHAPLQGPQFQAQSNDQAICI